MSFLFVLAQGILDQTPSRLGLVIPLSPCCLGSLGLKVSMVQTSPTQEDVRTNKVMLVEEMETLWPYTPLELLKLPLCMLRPNVPADARGCSSPHPISTVLIYIC